MIRRCCAQSRAPRARARNISSNAPATKNEINPALTAPGHHMPSNSQGAGGEGQDGLDFANVLRDCLSCAVINVDGQRKVGGMNVQAENLTHLRVDQVVGQAVEILPAPLQAIVNETFSAARPVPDRQIILRDAARGELAIQVSATPTLTGDGK